MVPERLAALVLALVLSPLLPSLVVRVKAFFGGRQGMPLLQPYLDLWKLLRKGTVLSRTATSLFRLGPIVALAATLSALVFLPMFGMPAVLSFPGDLVVLAALLGLSRFAIVLAAMDTGSSFEGMGASREVHFSALAEPTLFLSLAALAHRAGSSSLTGIAENLGDLPWSDTALPLLLCGLSLFVVMLAENARIPFDDPNTHLELTMIHEVMILDHSGPDLGIIHFQAGLKMWIFAGLIVSLTVHAPTEGIPAGAGTWTVAVLLLVLGVGVVESIMARMRLVHVPRLLVGAGVLALTALAWS
ncbi:NADH-quinone oxidoreductase subunit H [Myxococcota bacterium]|nr:NADH-quinone oxidoreductase subunit H [Myxococcota bacterium]